MRCKLLFLLLMSCAHVWAAQGEFRIPNDACEVIVEAFREADFALLIPVLFDLDDDAAFDSLFRSRQSVSEDAITEYTVSRADLKEDYKRNVMSLQRQFTLALAVADSLGIDWSKARYNGFTVHVEDEWLDYAVFYDFEIAVAQNGRTFWLDPGILRQTPSGWKLAAGPGCRFNWR